MYIYGLYIFGIGTELFKFHSSFFKTCNVSNENFNYHILCVTLKYPIFLSFHLLNQEEVMSSNYFPWGFTNFLDCIFCALSKQYSMVV